MLDVEERSDDLPALMVGCDVVAKSEVSISFFAIDSCSVSRSRIVRAVWWLSVKELAGIKPSLRQKKQSGIKMHWETAVLRIRIGIRRIRMFLGLPDPDPAVGCMYPDPDLYIIMQN